MNERPTERKDSIDSASRDDTPVHSTSAVEKVEENVLKTDEESKDTAEEPVESWPDEPQQEVAEGPAAVSSVLSAPEAAPSVTPDRKNELLLQARADRISWIQAVPLPYEISRSTDNDPWNQDDRLALLKDSNAVQSLPCIPQVLSSLYGMEQSTSADVAERIQSKLEPLGLNRDECQLATTSFTKQFLAAELSNATDKQQQALLENYHNLLTKLKTPECATLVQGMRRFIRNMPPPDEEIQLSMRSYLTSTFESLKSHAAWKGAGVDEDVKHALESFLYGQCREQVETALKDEVKKDTEFLDRLNSLQFVTPAHLEVACLVDADADELLKEAIDTLLSVDSYFSPYEKLQRILKVYHCVNTALSKSLNKDGGSRLPSADDVLPTLILTILRSKPQRIVSNLRMIEVFCPPEYLRGEAGYAYTNLYGAFQFLRDMNMDNPESLSISPDEFHQALEKSRASAKTHLEQVTANGESEESKKEDVILPVEIPVREVRAARLQGDTVDLKWAKRWQVEHGADQNTTSSAEVDTRRERADSLPDTLPSGFSRSYSYMVTRPEDIRVTDLHQLLAEYRMLVHATEQLLGERTARMAAERKERYARTRSALLTRAAEVDLSTKGKKKKDAA